MTLARIRQNVRFIIASEPPPEEPDIDPSAFYVTKSGNDSTGDGSVETPWLTIQKGVNTVTAGERLYVRVGTYTETSTVGSTGGINIPNSGTSGNEIIIEAYPGDAVIIDQNDLANGFNLYNRAYVKILGFEIKNTYWTTSNDDVGGIFGNGCNNITIENNHIHDVDGQAGTNAGGVRLDSSFDCTIHNNKIHDITVGGTQNGNAACIHGYFPYQMTVTQNTLYNAFHALYHKASVGTSSDGFTVERNLIHTVNQALYYQEQGGGTAAHGPQVINQNIFYNISDICVYQNHSNFQNDSMVITNNVFDNNGGTTSDLWIRKTDSTIATSNIFYGALTKDSQRYQQTNIITESDYNCYYLNNDWTIDLFGANTTYGTLAAWQASGEEASSGNPDLNSNQSNPLFVNAASRDYHLQGGSPLLTAGKGGIAMGAYITGSEQIGSTL